MKFAPESLEFNMDDLNSLSNDLANLEAETRTCDLIIYTGREETLHECHKLIFDARCRNFADILASNAQTSTGSRISKILKFPEQPTDVFRTFKHYLYSGRVLVTLENMFTLLKVSRSYGTDTLEYLIINYVRNNLSLATVCNMINHYTAANTQEVNTDLAGFHREPALSIFNYFRDNIASLKQRKLTGDLTKESVILLLQRRVLDIEENEIWRICLGWARHHIGLSDTLYPNQWTEEQRNHMRATLDGVVQHIQFISIDSSVFTEEVEPTGVVPFQLTRERFKHSTAISSTISSTSTPTVSTKSKELSSFERARNEFLNAAGSASGVECARALPRQDFRSTRGNEDHNKNRVSEDINSRLDPRVEMTVRSVMPPNNTRSGSESFFQGSSILTALASKGEADYSHILRTWVGASSQQWSVLFRGSSHGFSAQAFHRICDGAAPSIVLIRADTGNVGGGYTDIPWSKPQGKGKYVPSEKSFLFSLYNPGGSPTKFDIKKKLFAVSHHPDCGPVFGAGADLFICDRCDQSCDSYSNLPHSYDGQVSFQMLC